MTTPTNRFDFAATRRLSGLGQRSSKESGRKPLAMRKYQISALLEDGSVRTTDQIGPATPTFEGAFSAFAHGTLIMTSHGPVPVEDLVPGMKITTRDRDAQQLMWVGAMTLMPRSDDVPYSGSLTRIMADSFGMGRPETDLMAGPGARLLMRPSGHAERFGSERSLTPAGQIVDGMNAIEISPPRPVRVYHLCLRRHAIINAAGMETESYHPGRGFERNMGPNMLSLFLTLFAHIKKPQDFGPLAHARLPFSHEQEAADVA
ncbi:Hint domain-containing protein [Roseovarius salis]|uniref:Hint domain-containing protein n=1 Tax=Roseovarius salis TaxID=3376063 RepID=UPI0037C5C29F